MRQLSGLDAGFLALETPNAPMTIAGVSILGPDGAGGRLDVARLRELLRRRLGRAVALRRRLAAVPLDLTRPYWVELAPGQVDLDVHVEGTTLPEPGGWHELSELMAWELAQPLDRGRPLWHLLLADGLDAVPGFPAGSVALIGRAHHAAVDGVSGAEILGALFDRDADVAAASDGDTGGDGPTADGEPGALDLLRRAGRDLASAPRGGAQVLGRSLLGLAGGAVARLREGASAPPLPYTAPRTLLNRPIGAARAWAPAFLPLTRVKAVKDAAGATVNDVVLAVCAGALRGWLAAKEALPAKPLVAMVPVSVRSDDQRRAAGNQVSAMLVSLATDEADPRRRLERIRDAARVAKSAHRALGARTLVESTDLLPFALSGLAARLYSRLHLAERHRPIFNVVVTNVPGPPRPLTVAGAPLLAHVGAAPIFDGLGLILVVFSYAGTITVGVTADRATMPDAAAFAKRIEDALAELEGATSPDAT